MTTIPPHTPPTPPPKSTSILRRAFSTLRFSQRTAPITNSNAAPRTYPRLPTPSQERLDTSVTETPLDVTTLSRSDIAAAEEKGKTILYLAYGSNLCNETFRGRRGIRPLSQINVLVPSLRLTFDLPGLPYNEPCFANSALRGPDGKTDRERDEEGKDGKLDYHKDRWRKGMVGCVYEVTPSDYANIIATEGGGASYQDILVDCYPLPDDVETVPEIPSTQAFKAHTLFAPMTPSKHLARPDPSYAQPSSRYKKLITDGAEELGLPKEYQIYLQGIRPYTITTTRQGWGRNIIVMLWVPVVMAFFALTRRLQDKHGRSPKWVATLMGWMFAGMWTSYDVILKRVFGDGERTNGDTVAS